MTKTIRISSEESSTDEPEILVLGAGYAGIPVVKEIESKGIDANIKLLSEQDVHEVIHESHRCIRKPNVKNKITIPIEDIISSDTEFIQGRVVEVEDNKRVVKTEDGRKIDYDYLAICTGSKTAFFGIDGLKENAYTQKCVSDALEINRRVKEIIRDRNANHIVIGGAGLSGIQVSGEISEMISDRNTDVEITLVEGMDTIYPKGPSQAQSKLRTLLEKRDVNIITGKFIEKVEEDNLYLSDESEVSYDQLIWTGGIRGQDITNGDSIEVDEQNYRINVDKNLQTTDDRVFAAGDIAYIEQDGEVVPPNAEAAWESGEALANNICSHINGNRLDSWSYNDKGTAVSVGDDAVAHDVYVVPLLTAFSGSMARSLKKAISARWIDYVSGKSDAMKAWSDM